MHRKFLRRCFLLSALFCFVAICLANASAQDAVAAEGASTAIKTDVAAVRGTIESVKEFLATKGADYGLKILAALFIFFVGKWLTRILTDFIGRAMSKAKLEPTLISFVKNLCYAGMIVFVAIAALSALGIQTAQFIAVVGAAGLAVGLALQGSLSNFASGVLLVVFKPFTVGDFVELAGTKGTVQAVHIFNTVLNTMDNIRVIIPNAQVTGGVISNFTVNGTRRVDLVFGISYGDDINKAREVIEGVLAADERVLKDPVPKVAVLALADSSVNFAVRPWVKPADYWGVYFDVTAGVKLALEAAGITIPFPQRDVHMKEKTA